MINQQLNEREKMIFSQYLDSFLRICKKGKKAMNNLDDSSYVIGASDEWIEEELRQHDNVRKLFTEIENNLNIYKSK